MIFSQKRELVLASKSPRRKEYLQRYGLIFTVQDAQIKEHAIENESPIRFVVRMAQEKAFAIKDLVSEGCVILAADTIVVIDGKILGKPTSKDNAITMLTELNGRTHEVTTAYAIYDCREGHILQNSCTTKVSFLSLQPNLIIQYAEELEGLDKAGAYSIQGLGTFLIRSIEGSYNNVVGLPIEMVVQDFLKHGFIS